MNHFLYFGAVLIWGSTWLAISYQLGHVAPEVSVAWRFILAAALMQGWAYFKNERTRFSARDHGFLFAQGACLFGINYVLFYSAEQWLTSGLVALVCSSLVFMNVLGARLFFGTAIAIEVIGGSLLGAAGIACVFWPELAQFEGNTQTLWGITVAFIATLCASGGNLLASRNSRAGLPLIAATATAMSYGALLVTLFALVRGQAFVVEWTPRYLGALLYLAVFGSVVAFASYLTLIARVGPERAGYVNVAVPLVALIFSTLFETFAWKPATFLGLALCVAGNILILKRKA